MWSSYFFYRYHPAFFQETRSIKSMPIFCCCFIASLISKSYGLFLWVVFLLYSVCMTWRNTAKMCLDTFPLSPFLWNFLTIYFRFFCIWRLGNWKRCNIVSSLHLQPGHWFIPVIYCCMCPVGSHLCIVLHVCILLVCISFLQTLPTESPWHHVKHVVCLAIPLIVVNPHWPCSPCPIYFLFVLWCFNP